MLYNPRTVAAIAAAGLLAAFAAQANKGAEYKPHHAKEHHKNHFLTAGATYLEPSFNGLDYASITTGTVDGLVTVDTYDVQPGFDWGYFIQAGYRISHHYDVQASWAQFNSNLSDSVTAVGQADSGVSLTSSNGSTFGVLDLGESATVQARQNLSYSVFDANLGQYHDITEMLRTRIFAGVRYAQITSDVDTVDTISSNAQYRINDYDSSFSGVGPEVGMDLEYKVWHTIGVVGHFAAALLVGQQEASSYVYGGGEQVDVEADTVARLIPGLEAKLGANWNVPYAYEKTNFGIEAGYQVAYYWNVIDQVTDATSGLALSTLASSVGKPTHNYANYGNMGPYLNFTAMF